MDTGSESSQISSPTQSRQALVPTEPTAERATVSFPGRKVTGSTAGVKNWWSYTSSRPKEDENCWLEGEGRGQTGMEQNF